MMILLMLDIIKGIFSGFSLLFGGLVDELPYGIADSLTTFNSYVMGVIEVLPMLHIIWLLFVFAIFIKVALLTLEYTIKIIGIIRG